jgi:hypothetical protein
LLAALDGWPVLDVDAVRAAAAGWGQEQLQTALRHASAAADGLAGLAGLLTAAPASPPPVTDRAVTEQVTAVEPVATTAPAAVTAASVTADPGPARADAAAMAEQPALFATRPSSAPPTSPRSARASVGGLCPTGEQQAVIDACASGVNVVIEAGAGTGKTSTLRMAASTMRGRGLYVAFNRPVAAEARRSFPRHVQCATAHALAFRHTGHAYAHRLPDPKKQRKLVFLTGEEAAAHIGITSPLQLGEHSLTPSMLARYAADTVAAFCRTPAAEISAWHVPAINGVDGRAAAALADVLVPAAQRAWADIRDVDGRLRFAHDHYLKMWQLAEPKLDCDFLLYDEAQDADPVIATVMQAQRCQLIAVGDSCQAIYGWRGAVDAIATWPAQQRLYLSQSWRFGPAIAEEANKWLTLLRARLRLSGAPGRRSRLDYLGAADTDAVLCRTNSESMSQAIIAMDQGLRTGLVGGAHAVTALAEAALQLQAGQRTEHPELAAFASWGEVKAYADSDDASPEIAALVRLVDDLGADKLLAATRALTDERHAQVVVSTTHKAKGREWGRVQVGRDFRRPRTDPDGTPGPVDRAEAMLAYVAVTRARDVLDRGGLAWIDETFMGRHSAQRDDW